MIRVTSITNQGSVFVGTGEDEEGYVFTFGGDWRMGRDIAEALESGEEPEVDPPSWAILSVQAP